MKPPTETSPPSPAAPPGRLPWNVKILGWASCLNDIASEMVFPLLPLFLLSVLRGNVLLLGVIEGVAESVSSLLKLTAGAWSDRLRARRGFVVSGYALAVVARASIAGATVPWHLLVCRFADRVGKGVRTSPRDALISESAPREQQGRAFGFHRAMDHLGAAIGPLAAWAYLYWQPQGLRELFLLTLVPGAAAVLILLVGLRRQSVAAAPARAEAPRRPLSGRFKWFLLSLAVFTLGNSSDTFLLARAEDLGVATSALPLLWFAFHVAKSAGNYMMGGVVDRLGPKRPLVIGWLWYGAIYLGFALAGAAWHAWALLLGYAVYYALAEPAEKTLVAQLSGGEKKGLAFGWYNFTIGLLALPASWWFGALYRYLGADAAFCWGAGLAALASNMLLLLRKPQQGSRAQT
jgi:MFS family permease